MNPQSWRATAREKLVPFLQERLGAYSGKAIRRLLESNVCRINGAIERFGSRSLQGGDLVELSPHWKSLLEPTRLSFETLYEDADFLLINKPASWVCRDEEVRKDLGRGLFLVHRLDKDTTGVLALAKKRAVKEAMRTLFEERLVQKQYLAIVDGIPSEQKGVRKTFLSPKGTYQGQTIWGSGPKGLQAITHWQVKAVGKKSALVLCEPETGRTHQIRVHMAEMGHPLLIDRQYAKSFRCPHFFVRPLLHAASLYFCFEERKIEAMAPLPHDMSEALRQCGIEYHE